MKVCSKCKEEKSLSEFNKNKAKKDGYQHNCKVCQALATKKHYERTKDVYFNRKKEHEHIIRDYLIEVKKNNPCECGIDNPVVLQFHHINPKEKEINPSKMCKQGWGLDRVQKELDKCKVMCANCHIILHDSERSMYS